MGAQHAHGHGSDDRAVAVAFVLLSAFLVVEVVVAIAVDSIALLSDAGHMLSDVGALGVALWTMRLARRPARGTLTFGLLRAEILSALGNGITLLVVSGLVTAEAVRRLVHPVGTTGGAVLGVAIAGAVVNVAATWVLHGAARGSLNVEGAYRHVLTDLYGFAATIAAGIVIITTGFARADAIASLVVVVLMLAAAGSLLRASGRVLLEAAPAGMDLDDVRSHLLDAPHVRDVHDLHVWTLTTELPAISAHVVVEDDCFQDGHAPQVLDELQACIAGHFDVEHSTFQLEPAGHAAHENAAHA